ncbi:MAG TPA: rod shape-determining protein MreD [Intrasporangium sp.]|uniref:rod shape-determining protein MreD n=1 Tax=Intrasporangium sp. TaxID=1925024 RepID=UPI002D786241|nr:rod shape-determining protein MreD [Intrasporangium sp.]HET7397901.1 rod shape-determining protein MreD [Intrasporangium sp.]
MRPTTLGLLRTAYVVVAALLSATVLPRLGVGAAWVPDLVLVGVVATAVLRGPVHGALVGLGAGWLVELVPPVGRPLGVTPLVLALAGAAAGAFATQSSRSALRAPAALATASLVAVLGRLAVSALAEGGLVPGEALGRFASTVTVGLLILPALVAVDRALVRRRLG